MREPLPERARVEDLAPLELVDQPIAEAAAEQLGITLDAAGNSYVTGTTASVDFPTTPGGDRTVANQDAFVTKFSPTGAVVYSTYVGGPCNDVAYDVAVDAGGNAYLTGRANGLCTLEFPAGALVAKLGPTGALAWSLVFGGAYGDVSTGSAIAVDGQGHAYVTGSTSSPDFPTTPGALRTTPCPTSTDPTYTDGFVAKVSADGGALLYSTFLCGDAFDAPKGIALDGAGNAFVAGWTYSTNFPTVDPLQATNRAAPFGTNGFVSKLRADGAQLLYSTYLGGTINDGIDGLAVDGTGNAYVTGASESTDFPTTPGVLQPQRGNVICLYQFCTDAFVAKLHSSGTALLYSTYLYGEGDDSGADVAVDAAGNAYVAGGTRSFDLPTTAGAFQPGIGGGVCDFFGGPCGDAFVARITAGGPGAPSPIRVGVATDEAAPGGTVNASWALPNPTATDYLILYTLGSASEPYVTWWGTGGGAAGNLALTLPANLPAGAYELRLLTPDPNYGGLLQSVARSQPIYVGSAGGACGLGGEAIAVLPLMTAFRRRLRRRTAREA